MSDPCHQMSSPRPTIISHTGSEHAIFVCVGEVIVWDTSLDDDPMVFTSGIGDDSHRDPVGKVMWIPDPDSPALKFNVSTTIIPETMNGQLIILHNMLRP